MFKKNMLPTELHRYSLGDCLRGAVASQESVRRASLIDLPGLGEAIPVRSARAAVVIALRALGLPPGSRIGVPLYCCPVVFKAIRAAGCAPRFLDIEPETFCLSADDLRAKASGIDAVIAVHMFGNLCDMPEVLEIMRGKPVIEDCAQSIGSRLDGRTCGSFGDLSFFSFRSGKYLSVGEGGALYSPRPDLRARLAELVNALPVPSRGREVRHVFTTYLRSKLRSRPWWGWAGARIWATYNRRTEFADKSPLVLERIFASDLATLRRRIPLLDSLIDAQRAHSGFFERHLGSAPVRLCIEPPRARLNRFMYPITFFSTPERDGMAAHLRENDIGTSRPYEDVVEGAAEHYGYWGDCPRAELALRTALVVPVYSSLEPADLEHIVRSLDEGWAISRTGRGTPR
jgi:dTDP-4-amino-4,6-dideoxygalactose transaminase